jgi:hypothetical protein
MHYAKLAVLYILGAECRLDRLHHASQQLAATPCVVLLCVAPQTEPRAIAEAVTTGKLVGAGLFSG